MIYTSDPDGWLPLPPRWSHDPAAAADPARALDELAGVPWPLAGVHDFDQADAQGRCCRARCRVSFLDAGPECPGDPACAQPHPPGTHDQCPPGAPCHGGPAR